MGIVGIFILEGIKNFVYLPCDGWADFLLEHWSPEPSFCSWIDKLWLLIVLPIVLKVVKIWRKPKQNEELILNN